MKKNFLFVCDEATRSEEKGSLDIKGIFDSIASSGFPAKHSSFFIVANLEIGEDEKNKTYIESFKILSDGNVVIEDQTSFQPRTSRHQFLHKIQDIILEKPGKYDIQILIGEIVVAESYFMVKKI